MPNMGEKAERFDGIRRGAAAEKGRSCSGRAADGSGGHDFSTDSNAPAGTSA